MTAAVGSVRWGGENTTRYVVLAVASGVEAKRTPLWGNAVYAEVSTDTGLASGRVEDAVNSHACL